MQDFFGVFDTFVRFPTGVISQIRVLAAFKEFLLVRFPERAEKEAFGF